ncbi:MAG: lipoprotein signal peptidase [Proteobacteria bacterium]|nr:MAG: lipoprotein signal peptidase [Pseudomonadota bacterium]
MQKKINLSCRLYLLVLSLVMLGADQWTKAFVRGNLAEFAVKPFLPFWNWTLVYNQGAAFSFLANQGGWQKLFFGAIAMAVSIGIIYYLLAKTYKLVVGVAFSLILSGAVGNLVDRILHGKVTDFIDWYVGVNHWPAFNVADSCITVGVTLLIIDGLFFNKSKQ